ncbi:hypothetical protein [Chryseobacterium profundimaris]|uniref:Plasmid stabilization protein n=1 Tax=Chryseobacterium profundimaris TaxID=1387275 RepID=A0ABY1PD78_9FLAO|nr:hypothetical protein [Chryseobacterium profundimaris]SMP31266.1 hypothetical protein SAMN06264346_113106 [Chryseobacterium profundimaris]
MKILLSSIAKNDIRLLMRVFGAENKQIGIDFLESLKATINTIAQYSERPAGINTCSMEGFPVTIHYVFENEETLFVTAIFKN